MYNFMNNFIEAVTTRTADADKILVKFTNHAEPDPFTKAAIPMLIEDPITEYIIEASTGRVLYTKEA